MPSKKVEVNGVFMMVSPAGVMTDHKGELPKVCAACNLNLIAGDRASIAISSDHKKTGGNYLVHSDCIVGNEESVINRIVSGHHAFKEELARLKENFPSHYERWVSA